MKFLAVSLFFLSICFSDRSSPAHPVEASQKSTTGYISDSAMVVTAHPDATKVGIEILKQGGNAIDAAIAVQFALSVVYPNAGNIGGGGFLVYRNHSGEINSLDFREKAPSGSTKNMFIDPVTNQVRREWIESSHLASGVPGSVDGMWTAHLKYGSMSWEKLLQPSVDLALRGFAVSTRQAGDLNRVQKEFKKVNNGTTYFQKEKWMPGDTLIQIDLGNTLRRIQKYGRDGFYKGETAQFIVDEMQKRNGIISFEDLENYHSVWRQPVTAQYKNYEIISMPPPSSGGIALIQLLNSVEQLPLKEYGPQSLKSIHAMVESEKWVYADRSEWLGDPDFFKVPVKQLIDKSYAQQRMSNFSETKVTAANDIRPGSFTIHESDETTHFSIIDAWGNAVAVTTTLNDAYGSKIVVEGAGFILNNEMDDFSAKPGEPNLYGLIGGEANAIEPGKRMLSSMTPTIVLKDGNLFMVVGTPGGSTIITSVFQTIINVVEFDMTMQEAVNAPRFHNQWLPDEILIERGKFPPELIVSIRKMGYKINDRDAIGRVDAILVTRENQQYRLEGAADPRGDDMTLGY